MTTGTRKRYILPCLKEIIGEALELSENRHIEEGKTKYWKCSIAIDQGLKYFPCIHQLSAPIHVGGENGQRNPRGRYSLQFATHVIGESGVRLVYPLAIVTWAAVFTVEKASGEVDSSLFAFFFLEPDVYSFGGVCWGIDLRL